MSHATSLTVSCFLFFLVINHANSSLLFQGPRASCMIGLYADGKCGANVTTTCKTELVGSRMYPASVIANVNRCICNQDLKIRNHYCICKRSVRPPQCVDVTAKLRDTGVKF
ncbi:putative defensin-like protein 237 [Capsella rubella]|uniref:putative defensin-like protein 237 n=1 Tax=Capsella rubella TaxID=81985 RepID=UPI000CD4AE5C|nr:putative defensin-like protein 237 [Capsella rubella]